MVNSTTSFPHGIRLVAGYLDRARQEALRDQLRALVEAAPFFTPAMPRSGRPMSVQMTNCGPLGWVSDKARGYRYQATHPVTGAPWPAMPQLMQAVWRDLAAFAAPPEACLVNYYGPGAKMGLHQDRDEDCFEAPVISLSLGDTALFRVGGLARKDPTRSLRLASGDALVLGGPARLAHHGVDRILSGSSTLLNGWFAAGGRINLTLRRVSRPANLAADRGAVSHRGRARVA